MKRNLKYNTKICGFVYPLQICGTIVLQSRNTKRIYAEFLLSRYWEDDTNPLSYKLKLVPTPEYYNYVSKETFYSSDFVSILNTKKSFIVSKQIYPEFIKYVKENSIFKKNNYFLCLKNSDMFYNNYKLFKIRVPLSEKFNDIELYFKKGIFKKKLYLKDTKYPKEIMCRIFMQP